MSREVAALVYSRRVGSAAKKAVLAYFADKADARGKGVFPSKQTVADVTEMGRSTVIRAINEMVADGLISPVGRRKCQSGATTVYEMHLAAIAALPKVFSDDEAVPERDPMQSQSGTLQAVPERDQSQSGTGVVPERDPMQSQSGTQTVIEPSLNKEEPLVVPQPDDPPSKRRRSTSLPPEWVPSDRNLSDAHARNFTDQEIRHEADRFRDYHLARGTTFRDWDAGWRTWLDNARKFAASGPLARGSQHGGGKPVGGLVGAAMRSEAARGH